MLNKKFSLVVSALLVFAAVAEEGPKLLRVRGGDVRVNFSVARDMTPIDVYWQERPMMTGAIGSVLSYAEKNPGFVGLGRKHGSFKEKLERFTVKIDGKEVDWRTANSFNGKTAECERIIQLRDLRLVYRLKLEGNRLTEEISYTPAKDVKLQNLYHYHPWNKRFKEFVNVDHKNKLASGKFTLSKKILYHGGSVTFAICDPYSEDAAIVRYHRSCKDPQTRYIQDNWNGAVECFIECSNRRLSSGRTESFRIEMDFLEAKNAKAVLEQAQKTAK